MTKSVLKFAVLIAALALAVCMASQSASAASKSSSSEPAASTAYWGSGADPASSPLSSDPLINGMNEDACGGCGGGVCYQGYQTTCVTYPVNYVVCTTVVVWRCS